VSVEGKGDVELKLFSRKADSGNINLKQQAGAAREVEQTAIINSYKEHSASDFGDTLSTHICINLSRSQRQTPLHTSAQGNIEICKSCSEVERCFRQPINRDCRVQKVALLWSQAHGKLAMVRHVHHV
jgi:hypothetical protein